MVVWLLVILNSFSLHNPLIALSVSLSVSPSLSLSLSPSFQAAALTFQLMNLFDQRWAVGVQFRHQKVRLSQLYV